MANSKSNIYPIQLQGAELCLNRYDAEIKQYRGFNKNNSPFVGGCLSNVFTKEEQISGGNADNTYIDTNGDVYRVDNEGLYQNENQLIKFNEGNKFYQKRKLNLNKNVVKAISEKIYITLEYNLNFPANEYEYRSTASKATGYVVHWGDGYSAILGEANTYAECKLDINYKDDKIVFTQKRYIDRGTTADGLVSLTRIIYIPDENNSNYTLFYPSLSNAFLRNKNLTQLNFLPQSVYMTDEGFYLALNESTAPSYLCYYDYNLSAFRYSATFTPATIGSTEYLLSSKFANWFMTSDGFFVLYQFYYQSSDSSVTPPSTARRFIDRIRVFYDDDSSSFKMEANIGYLWIGPRSIAIQSTSAKKTQHGHFSSAGACFVGLYGDTSSNGYLQRRSGEFQSLFININDDVSHETRYFYEVGGVVVRGRFKILYNNGTISGLSVVNPNYKNRKNSFHGVLVSDWGEIESLVIIDDEKVVYRTFSNDYYEISTTEKAKLSLKNNQIVINCDCEENSYNLDLKQVVHYASDWNCSYITTDSVMDERGNVSYIADTATADYIVGSAINEQTGYQKYNSSVIFNTQNVAQSPRDLKNDLIANGKYLPWLFGLFNTNSSVNFYINNAGTKVESFASYYISGSSVSIVNKNLEGLPFPNNTDGNVQFNPNMFSEFIQNFGIDVFVKNEKNVYQLMKEGQENIMSYFLGTLIEGLELVFILQGQYYGIIGNKLFGLQFNNGVVADTFFIVNVQGLQFVGNTPYEALFFSKTNRCLYSFTGANVLNQKQLVDKISEVRNYLYNPATQTVFLITDIGVLFYGLFGMFLLEYTNISNIFLLDNGIVMSDNSGNYRYIKYYLDEGDTDYTKENINVETSFYGMNNEVVTINDCLYFRIFSEEHEEGDLKVSATTISLSGRKTEETTFKIKASDWDKITHTIYLRYQPKTQRGLGVAFAIDSPFKIASLSVGSQPDAVLVDKVSKGAITAPSVTTNNNEW